MQFTFPQLGLVESLGEFAQKRCDSGILAPRVDGWTNYPSEAVWALAKSVRKMQLKDLVGDV